MPSNAPAAYLEPESPGIDPKDDVLSPESLPTLASFHEPSTKRGWKDTLSVLVAGVALFSDGYNIEVTAYTNTILAKLYPKAVTTAMKTRLSNSILIGDIFGMILFGICSDRLGRRWGIIGCTFFLVVGILIATAAHGSTPTGMMWMMVVGRGMAGLGAGGEYAVCTTAALEAADETDGLRRQRGRLVILATNVAIYCGFVASSIVCLVLIAAYHQKPSDGIWRIAYGIGMILPLAVFVIRMRMLNSTQYKKHAIRRQRFPYALAVRRYWRPLLGCCVTWFLYDAVVYPFNLLAPTLVAGFGNSSTLIGSIGWAAFINMFSLPGAVFGSFAVHWIGSRKRTYAYGYLVVAVFGFAIGGALPQLREAGTGRFAGFVVLFAAFQCFLSAGPGNLNFLVASESFPTPVRGQFLGFAAAIGKVGAAVGTQVFPLIEARFSTTVKGQQAIFLIGAGLCVAGATIVMGLVPDRTGRLEEEDADFRRYLEANGWDTSDMGIVADGEVKEGDGLSEAK